MDWLLWRIFVDTSDTPFRYRIPIYICSCYFNIVRCRSLSLCARPCDALVVMIFPPHSCRFSPRNCVTAPRVCRRASDVLWTKPYVCATTRGCVVVRLHSEEELWNPVPCRSFVSRIIGRRASVLYIHQSQTSQPPKTFSSLLGGAVSEEASLNVSQCLFIRPDERKWTSVLHWRPVSLMKKPLLP